MLLAWPSSAVCAAPRPPPEAAAPPAAEPAPSSAEPAPADSEQLLAAAKAAQAKAARLFRDNQFVEAAQLLQLAYQYDPRPILLFNAGQSYRKAERAVEAKLLYEQFLAAAPQHALGPETRGYMEALIAMQLRAQQVALALEEQLAAQQSSEKQAARALSLERQHSLQIHQALLQTQEQLERDRKKLSSRRRWLLGLSIGIPLAMGAIIGSLGGGFYYSRISTDGGTAVITK
jgi:tetratricopeptide (TPR) repeat protein